MKKAVSIMLSVCLALSFSACFAEGAAYKAGVYTAQSRGMQPMTIEVEFSDSAITRVDIVEQAETYGIGCGLEASPVDCLPGWIVENQSLGCDAVTGATISSYAVINGVADAVKQAGGDADALKAKKPEAEAVSDKTLECDVVVAGAGAAGLGAAVSAVESGAKVILLEELGVTGGSTVRCGGYFFAAGTNMQKEAGIEDSPEAMFDFYKQIGKDQLDDEKVMTYCENSADTFEWIVANGAKFDGVLSVHPTHTTARVHNSYGGQFMGMGQGGHMTVPMTKAFTDKGGELIYDAAADALVLDENGNVAGLIANMKDGSKLTVLAKSVVLATGGYAGSKELCERFAYMPNFASGAPASDNGDAMRIVEAVDGKVEWSDRANITMVGGTTGVGCYGEAGLIVNEKGDRVCDEYNYFYVYTEALINSGSSCGWYISDADDPFPTVQYAMTLDSIPHASSVEELAEKIGVDAKELSATVERYNEFCAAGEDADFGKPAMYLNAIDGDTIIAVQLTPSISGTYGGVMTNVSSEVINNSGAVVAGLYAAGESAFCGLVGSEYPCCGTAIGTSFYFGRVAGQNAAGFATGR